VKFSSLPLISSANIFRSATLQQPPSVSLKTRNSPFTLKRLTGSRFHLILVLHTRLINYFPPFLVLDLAAREQSSPCFNPQAFAKDRKVSRPKTSLLFLSASNQAFSAHKGQFCLCVTGLGILPKS